MTDMPRTFALVFGIFMFFAGVAGVLVAGLMGLGVALFCLAIAAGGGQ